MRILGWLVIVLLSCHHNPKLKWVDGIYRAESQAQYTQEPYWGQVELQIKNDRIISIRFMIVDKARNMDFDRNYEAVFAENEEYRRQCRNDWHGSIEYPKRLLASQKLEDVESITGATWSYQIFKDAVRLALGQAERKQ